MGEELCACIKLEPNQTMTPDELKRFCKDKVIFIEKLKIIFYIKFLDKRFFLFIYIHTSLKIDFNVYKVHSTQIMF